MGAIAPVKLSDEAKKKKPNANQSVDTTASEVNQTATEDDYAGELD